MYFQLAVLVAIDLLVMLGVVLVEITADNSANLPISRKFIKIVNLAAIILMIVTTVFWIKDVL